MAKKNSSPNNEGGNKSSSSEGKAQGKVVIREPDRIDLGKHQEPDINKSFTFKPGPTKPKK